MCYQAKQTTLNNEAFRPIGIFDSGVGGLTVARAIKEVLPNESIIYFGDTANMPYGDKSQQDIQLLSIKIAKFLSQYNCKLIVIACNSATAAAYDFLKAHLPVDIILINVIDPVVSYLAENYANKRVGLIATQQTIESQIYDKKIEDLNVNITLSSLATRLLAPAIEEFDNTKLFSELLKEYLSDKSLQEIDTILLGCTHYPIVKAQIADFYNHKIDIIDSSYIVAKSVKDQLIKSNLLNKNKSGKKKFFVSQQKKSFDAKVRSLFCNDAIQVKQFAL
jgi:glutamate racemase